MKKQKMKFRRVELSQKDSFGQVHKVRIDFGFYTPDQVQSSLVDIRSRYPGWKLIACYAIKEDQYMK